MRPLKTPEEMWLYLTDNYSRPYYTMEATPTIVPSAASGTNGGASRVGLRRPGSSDYDETLPWANFRIRAQGDEKSVRSAEPLYAWQYNYHEPYEVSLVRAKAMVKLLTHVDKQYQEACEQFGRPTTYGQYVVLIGNIIGCQRILVETRDRQGRYWGYSEPSAEAPLFQLYSMGEGVSMIDRRIRKWQESEGVIREA